MKTITVIVSPTGETRVETAGFAGSACQEATRALEAALGTRESEQLTAEFYSQQQQHDRLREGGGT